MRTGCRKVLAALAILGLVLFAAGCRGSTQQSGGEPAAGPDGATGDHRRGGVLRVVDEPPNGFFGVPWEIVGNSIVSAVPALEPLLWVDWSGKVYPKLAERWDADPQNKSITLYLRQGVKFHDGTNFNAEAVRFNLNKAIETKRIPLLASVEVLDEHTVKLNLTQWDNSIFLYLGGTAAVMVSPTAIKKNVPNGPGIIPSARVPSNSSATSGMPGWNTSALRGTGIGLNLI